jgi:hypothetical protein
MNKKEIQSREIPIEEERKPVPQLLESGFSADYHNAVFGFELICQKHGPLFLQQIPESHRIPTYQEWFPEDRYDGVVNEKNRDRLPELDAIIGELNEMMANGEDVDTERFLMLCEEAHTIINGRDNATSTEEPEK